MGAIGNFLLPDYPSRTLEGMRRPQQLLYYGGAVPSSFEFKDPGGQLVQEISRLEPKITIWVGGHALGHLGLDNSQQILGEGRHQRYGLQDLAGACFGLLRRLSSAGDRHMYLLDGSCLLLGG